MGSSRVMRRCVAMRTCHARERGRLSEAYGSSSVALWAARTDAAMPAMRAASFSEERLRPLSSRVTTWRWRGEGSGGGEMDEESSARALQAHSR